MDKKGLSTISFTHQGLLKEKTLLQAHSLMLTYVQKIFYLLIIVISVGSGGKTEL